MNALAESTPHAPRWPMVLLAVAVFVVFGQLCVGEFSYWDDSATVYRNAQLNPPTWASLGHVWTHFAQGLYIPFTYSVWMALALIARVDQPDDRGATLNPWVFHAANVCVHYVTTLIVYQLLRRLARNDRAALIGALVWALHPVQVETVGWISGLKDLLAGMLGMMALWRYVVRAQRNQSPDVVGTTALVLALISKPSATVIPAIALAIDWLLIGRTPRRALAGTASWFLIVIPFAIIARLAQQVDDSLKAPLWARPMIVGDTVAFYLAKILVPMNLGMDYGRTPARVMQERGFASLALVPLLAILAVVWTRKKYPWLGAAMIIFLLAILPTSGVATFQYQYTSTTADHYLYLAMLGPALVVTFLVPKFHPRGAVAFCAVVVTVLGAIAMHQAQYWRNDLALFSRAVAINPDSFVAHNNLGIAYLLQRNNAAAEGEFRESIRLSEEFPPAYENLARVLGEKGDVDGSIAIIEKSIAIRARLPRGKYPNYMEDHNAVGQLLLARGRYDEATAHFKALLEIKPEHAEAARFLKIAQEKLAETQRAATRPGASGRFIAPR